MLVEYLGHHRQRLKEGLEFEMPNLSLVRLCPAHPPARVCAAEMDEVKVLAKHVGQAGAEEALKFLVHWMGDMHQPLHMSGREKGGNGAKVAWNGRSTSEYRFLGCSLEDDITAYCGRDRGIQLESLGSPQSS